MNISDRIKFLVASGQASASEMETAGRDTVVAIKANPRIPQVRCKASQPEDMDDRVLRYTASDESVDRMGDIVRQGGWKLDNFKSNPTILWAHDGDTNPPVGKALATWLEETPNGPALKMDVEYASKEAHPLADTIFQLSKGGFLPAVSVGFLPIEAYSPEGDDERKAMGLGTYGVEFRSAELLETSNVSTPANPNALQNGLKSLVGKGLLQAKEAIQFEDTTRASTTAASWKHNIERMFDAMIARVVSDNGGLVTGPHKLSWGMLDQPADANLGGFAEALSDTPWMSDYTPVVGSAALEAAVQENTKALRSLIQELAAVRYLSAPKEVRASKPLDWKAVESLLTEFPGIVKDALG